MKCYKQLVRSKFLAKAFEELACARKKLQTMEAPLFDTNFTYNKADRKYIYDCYLEDYMLIEELVEQFESGQEYKDVVYYMQESYILFIYSRSRKLIKEAISYSFNVHGDIPIHKSRHIIHGKAWFTALVDTRMPFQVSSPN